ncbi:MAG: hypothetical protein ABR555_00220 [Pyrinomonadaceae bacterium]
MINLSPQTKFRLVGLLPLFFFFAQGIHYWRINEFGHVLWMCNIGNFLLAMGLFINDARLMRIAIIWTVPGLLIWFLYVVMAWGVFLTSTLAHVGGIIVAMFVLKRIGMERNAWLLAFLWYLAIQLASRLITSANLNVNLSHKMQPGWEHAFSAYWQFWLTLTITTAIVLWAVGYLLTRLKPAR